MDFKKINKVVEILDKNSLTEFTYEEKNGFKLTLKREIPAQAIMANGGNLVETSLPASFSLPVTSSTQVIKAPLVGTFYSSPNPNAPLYIKEGDSFKEGDTLCIVEAMKVMNEIKAECSGVITKILVQDGESVEYDQALYNYK